MSAYATPADLIERHDVTTIGELCSDTGTAITAANLPTDANCLAALADASGDVEAAMGCGNRYSPDDLAGLTGNSLAKLKRIVCTIAMAYLFERRPAVHYEQAQNYLERAKQYLEDLRAGRNVFNIADHLAAANPTIDGPTSYEYQVLNLLPDRMVRHFPSRKQRLPTTRG